MPALQVRDFPDELYEDLRDCAAAECRSIAQQATYILKEYLVAYGRKRKSQGESFQSSNLVYVDFDQGEAKAPARRASYVQLEDDESERQKRIEERRRLFARIRSRTQLEIPDDFPSAAELIREDREGRPSLDALGLAGVA